MHLKSIELINSPISTNNLRLVGEVIYDDTAHSDTYWFDIPKKYKDDISNTGNLWLACLIPLAVTLNEPLKICRPVDIKLLENMNKLMLIWKNWYPKLNPIQIECDKINSPNNTLSLKTAAFFSGGVDSFFTILHNNIRSNHEARFGIEDLLTVCGFDIPLKNSKAFIRLKEKYEEIAFEFGYNFVDFITNIRETRWKVAEWGYLSHGCALASIALTLEKRYENVLIPASYSSPNFFPWGSHPVTDPLFSTSNTKFIHDGHKFNRIEKTKFVAGNEIALNSMRVCWQSFSDYNCSSCSKCYRTMITLDLLGKLKDCRAFTLNQLNATRIKKIFITDEHDICFFQEIKAFALKIKRLDIVYAIEESLKNSQNLNKRLAFAKRLSKWLAKKRFVWRWSDYPKKLLLKGSII